MTSNLVISNGVDWKSVKEKTIIPISLFIITFAQLFEAAAQSR